MLFSSFRSRPALWLTVASGLLAAGFVAVAQRMSAPLRYFPLQAPPLAILDGNLYFHQPGKDSVEREPLFRGRRKSIRIDGLASAQRVEFWRGTTGHVLVLGMVGRDTPGLPSPGVQNGEIERVRLWDISPEAESGRELMTESRMRQAVIAGERCFWLKAKPPSPEYREGPGRRTPILVPRYDLMVNSLDGSPSRRLASDLEVGRITAFGDGVLWQGRPGEGSPHFVLPPDFTVRTVKKAEVGFYLGDRLLWRRVALPFDPSQAPPGVVVQGDTTWSTTNLKGEDSNPLQVPNGYEGPMFVQAAGGPPIGLLGSRSSRQLRLFSVVGNTIVAGRQLTSQRAEAWFRDGEMLYYLARRDSENWLDWSAAGLSGNQRLALFAAGTAN